MKKALLRGQALLLTVLCGVLVSSCYMPLRFDAEIVISRDGYYSMIFDGYVAKVPFYDGLRTGKIDSAGEPEQAETYRKDLAGDPSMTEVSYYKQGIYKVHWERTGDIFRSRFVTFIRRNENMLSLRYVRPDGTIQLAGASAGRKQRQRLRDMGLDMVGEIRVITDANVIDHNATTVRDWPDSGPEFRMYTWEIPDIFTPSPDMTIQIH